MSTVTFDMQMSYCSGCPHFKEADYSIHLRNRLSPEEVSQGLHEMNIIVEKFFPRQIWLWIAILLMIIPWIGWVIYVVNVTYFNWIIFVFIFIIEYIPIFLWIAYRRYRLRVLRDLLERQASNLNQRFQGRNINWRIRGDQLWWHNHRNRVGWMAIEIEIGEANAYPMYQQPMMPPIGAPILPPYQYGYPQPPMMQSQPSQPAQPYTANYSPSQPLLDKSSQF